MITSELYSIVDRYLQKNITLEEFEDWIVARFQLFFSSPPSTVSEFVAEIELGLAELSNGSRTEEEFRNFLRELLQEIDTVWVPYPEESVRIGTSSSNTVSPSVAYSADSQLSVVLT